MNEKQFETLLAVLTENTAALNRQTEHLEQIERRLYATDKRADEMRRATRIADGIRAR